MHSFSVRGFTHVSAQLTVYAVDTGSFRGKRKWNTKVIFLSQKKINFTHLFWIISKQPKVVFAEDIWLSPNHKNFDSLQIIYALSVRRTVSQIKYE